MVRSIIFSNKKVVSALFLGEFRRFTLNSFMFIFIILLLNKKPAHRMVNGLALLYNRAFI